MKDMEFALEFIESLMVSSSWQWGHWKAVTVTMTGAFNMLVLWKKEFGMPLK